MENDTRKKVVLIVDDIQENIEVLGRVLSQDYEVLVAMSGADALKIAQESPTPDLILLDIMMPEMDGYEVCRRLKKDPATTGVPVIFVTAKDEAVDEAMGFEVGGVDYIAKPLIPIIVLARVKTQLSLAS